MNVAAQGFEVCVEFVRQSCTGFERILVLERKVPHAAQKAIAAFHRCVVPLQRHFGWRGEHGVEPCGVCAVFFNQVLRIDAVVFGLGHGAHALVIDGCAHWQIAHGSDELGTHNLARVVKHMLHVFRPEIFFAALVGATAVNVVEHHALGEQLGERLVHRDQPHVAHDLGPKTRIQQMKNGVLNATNVLVHTAAACGRVCVAHPIRRAFGHHVIGVVRVAIAHEIPRRIDKGVHRVGLASRGFAAYRAGHAGMKTFVFV